MPKTAAQADLFEKPPQTVLPVGVLVRSRLFDRSFQADLAAAVADIDRAAPFQRPRMRGKGQFSAAITNAGDAGWWSDEHGYRYIRTQPDSTAPWPAMPVIFTEAVRRAVAGTPWPDFAADACLINFYGPEAKMGLHQDKDERDFTQPIVTVSLGDAADFLIGGPQRSDRPQVVRVESGDVMLMGPPSRMLFHGVRRIYSGTSPIPGIPGRYSLTFRKAL